MDLSFASEIGGRLEQRPAFVRFEAVEVEDRAASIREGRYVATTEDRAYVTPSGGKDEVVRNVQDWFGYLDQAQKESFIDPKLVRFYRQSYDAWREGRELPSSGTPIMTWQILTPEQRSRVLAANIRTVEDLAEADERAIARVGMGARMLVMQAKEWLRVARDTGSVSSEIAGLRALVEQQAAELQVMRESRGGAAAAPTMDRRTREYRALKAQQAADSVPE